jgi:TonB-dependent Receptor Plug Domain
MQYQKKSDERGVFRKVMSSRSGMTGGNHRTTRRKLVVAICCLLTSTSALSEGDDQAVNRQPKSLHKEVSVKKMSRKKPRNKTKSKAPVVPLNQREFSGSPRVAVPSAENISVKTEVPRKPLAYKPAEGEEVMGLTLLGEIEVKGRANDLEGVAASASQGQVSNDDFKNRPLSRPGELIEVVPGMIATQHSGTGKANQYFLRGYNLDHGTDFTTWIDGVPMNLRSNAHGQGYMDLNSLIPELVDTIEYGKGPYYAEQGDFSSAGYAKMTTKNKITGFNNDSDDGILKFEPGQFNYYRGVIANSNKVLDGDFLYAFEYTGQKGPWVVPEDGNKYNGMLKYTFNWSEWDISAVSKAYYAHWTSTNQIPQASLGTSLSPTCCDITGQDGFGPDGRFGSMNPSDHGVTDRYTTSVTATTGDDHSKTTLNLYGVYYSLNLFSDFTYYLANPYQGDQVHQHENRVQLGGATEQIWFNTIEGIDMSNKLGMQWRYDQIGGLGISNTVNDKPVADNSYMPPSFYNVQETSFWFYGQNESRWTSWLRSLTAARSDTFIFDVQDVTPGFQYNAQNSGNTARTVLSPKFNLVFGPWEKSEVFINSGYSYHSNDARGTVEHYNPDGTPTTPVSPLAWARGAEIGARTQIIPGLNTTLAFWTLHSSQELIFSGDDGTTQVTPGTNRIGVEFTNYYKPWDWLILDADFAFTQSRYQTPQNPGCTGTITTIANGCGSGYSVPNAVGQVISLGAEVRHPDGYYGLIRLRDFGHDAVNNNATAWLGTTNIVNFGTGWMNKKVKISLDILNLFNDQGNDIAYWYTYGLCTTFSTSSGCPSGQATAVNGVTFHPVMPRTIRGGISINF